MFQSTFILPIFVQVNNLLSSDTFSFNFYCNSSGFCILITFFAIHELKRLNIHISVITPAIEKQLLFMPFAAARLLVYSCFDLMR